MTDGNRQSESEAAIRTYALEPVFVFDPQNHSNPPLPGDPLLIWWPIYPHFFRKSTITVPSKRRLGVRTMVIDFGSVRAGSASTRQRAR